jgi:hypothetical protein
VIDYNTILFTAILQVAKTGNAVGELAELAEVRDLAGYTREQALELTNKLVSTFESAEAAAACWVPIFQEAINQHHDIVETLKDRQQPEGERRSQKALKPFCTRKVKW